MDPQLMRLSRIMHEERLKQAEAYHKRNSFGPSRPKLSERVSGVLSKFSQARPTLGKLLEKRQRSKVAGSIFK